MPNLYIIAGCNGAGKTTASFTILPEILNCREFVNADSIAAGLSPFNPESVAFEAGRIMLQRIHERRYYRGILNLINLYMPISDTWIVINNKDIIPEPVAEGGFSSDNMIINGYIWDVIMRQYKQYGNK
ncbi:MAG: hypothetical protein ABUM51_06555 [Bacteroidota bacterium]